MGKGGRENGKLKAPHRQIIEFGICPRHTAAAIREAEELGVIDCVRGGMRVATTYALAWLPLHDGTAATNRWRAYSNLALRPVPQPKSRNLPEKGKATLPEKGKADRPNLPEKGKADGPENLPEKGQALSRSSYQGSAVNSDLSAGSAARSAPLDSTDASPAAGFRLTIDQMRERTVPSKLTWHTPDHQIIELAAAPSDLYGQESRRSVSQQETPLIVSPLTQCGTERGDER
jgi:hypothetical protein